MSVNTATIAGKSKFCIWCDKPIIQGKFEEDCHYKRKVYCDRFCSSAHIGARSKLKKKRPVTCFGMQRRKESNADSY
jgi:hypothetical protein